MWTASAALVTLLAAGAGTVVQRAMAETLPPPTATLDASFPSAVPGQAEPLPWPSHGQADVVTSTGVAMGHSGPRSPQPIGSVTKVMTAYVVLRDHPLAPGQSGPTLTVDAASAASVPARQAAGESIVPVVAGEQLTEFQALEALLIPSADNIADLLANFDAGSLPAFVGKMNATARQLGMASTSYADPSGLDPASASTAADQITLAEKAMAIPVFAAIVAERSARLPVAGTVSNYDSLVGTGGYSGIKTGSTNAAGGCFVWSVRRDVDGAPVTLYGAVLGQVGGPYVKAALHTAEVLTSAAFAELEPRVVVPAGTKVFEVGRAGRQTFSATVHALETIDPPGTPVTVTVDPAAPHGFAAGEGPSAVVTLSSPDGSSSTPVALASRLPQPTFGWRVRHSF